MVRKTSIPQNSTENKNENIATFFALAKTKFSLPYISTFNELSCLKLLKKEAENSTVRTIPTLKIESLYPPEAFINLVHKITGSLIFSTIDMYLELSKNHNEEKITIFKKCNARLYFIFFYHRYYIRYYGRNNHRW